MPRQARIDAPNALHHIIIRGIERRKIFRDNKDRDNFIERLDLVLTETGTPCYAWALIPNHVHLLLKTGNIPISTVMRRLLTGHAAYFNRRHRRHGKLFQSRYKSILCQEDSYLLELVRYIHLNPIRAKLLSNLKSLDKWAYCGHSTIMGKQSNLWQDAKYVLSLFGETLSSSRQNYRKYVEKGLDQGKRPELTGGGLIRSLGGWASAKMLRKSERMKSDERILGDGDFVKEVLKTAEEQYESRHLLQMKGYNLEKIADRVSQLTGVDPEGIWAKGKHPDTVQARSLLCYWACRDLGMKTTDLAELLGISQPSVSQSVRRGEKLCRKREWKLDA
jgi:REP element-mobilizing transposase RayT